MSVSRWVGVWVGGCAVSAEGPQVYEKERARAREKRYCCKKGSVVCGRVSRWVGVLVWLLPLLRGTVVYERLCALAREKNGILAKQAL